MSNMHRIQWFDQQIRAGNYPNSNHLAERFEISKRQAQRDIEYLEVSLHAPLLYIAKHRGYCYADNGYYVFQRQPQHTSEVEQEAKAIQPNAPVHSEAWFAHCTQQLQHAIKHALKVYVLLQVNGQEQAIVLSPLHLLITEQTATIFAYRQDQEQYGYYSLRQLEHVFVTRDNYDSLLVDPSSNSSSSIGSSIEPYMARLLLKQPVLSSLWGGYYIRSVQGMEIEVEFYDVEAFIQQLLVSQWDRIIAPHWLRAQVHQQCLQLFDRLNEEC